MNLLKLINWFRTLSPEKKLEQVKKQLEKYDESKNEKDLAILKRMVLEI